MKLSGLFPLFLGIFYIGLSSCSHHDEVEVFTEPLVLSVSTSDYRMETDIPNFHFEWTTFEMNISEGKANCLLNNMHILYPNFLKPEVTVKVMTSTRRVRVLIEQGFERSHYSRNLFYDISFTLDNLPQNDFIFEVVCNRCGDSSDETAIEEVKDPHLREIIHIDDPQNSHLIFTFERFPNHHHVIPESY